MELQQLSLDDVITEKILSERGKKYCSSCTSYKSEIGGEYVVSGGSKPIKRWKCATCMARRSATKYASKRKK